MSRLLSITIASLMTVSASAASAQQIINLSANGASANSGPVTQANGGPTANPLTFSFAAGTYTVSLIGTAAGGAYNAYSVATPANGNFTEQYAGFSINGVSTLIQPLSPTARYATALDALAAYQAAGPLSFTIAQTTNVSFFIEDAASAFFADDTGGVSFSVQKVTAAVPEPATWAMMLIGFGAMGYAMRRRTKESVRVSYSA